MSAQSVERKRLAHIQDIEQNLRNLAESRMVPEMTIIDPWSGDMTPEERAQIHKALLAATYALGHPGSSGSEHELMQKQIAQELLTWIVLWKNYPVGMVNFDIQSRGVAEVVRSVSLPQGYQLPDNEVYSGQANMSAAMYQRIPDLLARPEMLEQLWAIEGDVRLAREIILPTGKVLPAGVRTQHINHLSGLKPYLLVVPRYTVHPEGGNAHQEVFLQSRLYLQSTVSELEKPIYTPLHRPGGGLSIADIVRATYWFAHGKTAQIVEDANVEVTETFATLEHTAGEHYSTLYLHGNVEADQLNQLFSSALQQSRFVEIIVQNVPENIELQSRIFRLPVMPLGVFPGGDFVLSNGIRQKRTTIHFGAARPMVVNQMVEVDLASDYQNTCLEGVIYALRNEWRKYGVPADTR